MKTIFPSSSYKILLPEMISTEVDEGISSYWKNGEPLLLQLSSYSRNDGDQVGAAKRLEERMAAGSGEWELLTQTQILPNIDQALALTSDRSGNQWLHAYLVWSHLTIYATLSGPEVGRPTFRNWAWKALQSIELVVH